jgi:hypothetical protein
MGAQPTRARSRPLRAALRRLGWLGVWLVVRRCLYLWLAMPAQAGSGHASTGAAAPADANK